MGIKTTLSLTQAQKLFPKLFIKKLIPTKYGIIDTTYIMQTDKNTYILKRFENSSHEKQQTQKQLSLFLFNCYISHPKLLKEYDSWYIYEFIYGKHPYLSNYRVLQTMARYIKRMHQCSSNNKHIKINSHIYERINIDSELKKIKKKSYYNYKHLSSLKNLDYKYDGIIHGDLFPDNIIIYKNNIHILDIVDMAKGSFLFDIAVFLLMLYKHKNHHHYIQYFIQVYNQNSSHKICLEKLLKSLDEACKFYSLIRFSTLKKINTPKIC